MPGNPRLTINSCSSETAFYQFLRHIPDITDAKVTEIDRESKARQKEQRTRGFDDLNSDFAKPS